MKEKEIKTIQPKTKIDVQGTLSALTIGIPSIIKSKDIKACSIRSAIRCLRDKGLDFKVSEKGMIDSVKVTRLK